MRKGREWGKAVVKGSDPDARLLRRKKRDASRGSPRSLAVQRTLAREDKSFGFPES
jgi:hypothetical protein